MPDSAEYNPTDTNVSLNYADGLITAEGENMTSPNNIYVSGKVGNDGTVNTDNISVIESGNLSNNTSGTLNSDISLDKGMLTNNGEISGTVSSRAVRLPTAVK